MLENRRKIDCNEWVDTFDRKFSNFCSKNILSLSFDLYDDAVEISDSSGNMTEVFVYEFNFNKSVKSSIHDIIQELENYYPKLYITREKEYSIAELKELLRDHTVEEVEAMKLETEKVLGYTIFRVNNFHNEINVIDHTDYGKRKAYKLKIPVVKFIEALNEDKDRATELFMRNFEFVTEL